MTSENASGSLEIYHEKRDFRQTPEPFGEKRPTNGQAIFVVQKHAARQLHYDFRLELDGVLKSWAVPKGPSLDPAARRLAVHVEDHPMEYADFEGTIPEKEYGAGTVMVWDRGIWEPVGDVNEGYSRGSLKFILRGEKLHGSWALVRMKGRASMENGKENWLLIKERDGEARTDGAGEIVQLMPCSVLTGRSMEEIEAAESPPLAKGDLGGFA
jgi:bifunctional non-homologous end joining protein LigD